MDETAGIVAHSLSIIQAFGTTENLEIQEA